LASLHPRRIVASVLDDDEPPARKPVSRAQAMTPASGDTPYDADAT